jgi:3-phytase
VRVISGCLAIALVVAGSYGPGVPASSFQLPASSFNAGRRQTLLYQARSSNTERAEVSRLEPVARTAAVSSDPDDPALWVHPTDPARSLILGTDKVETTGALYAFGLDGAFRQAIRGIDRPNNVDVEYGFRLRDATTDIAVLTERKQHRLRIFSVAATGDLTDLAPEGLSVLAGENGDASEPMGIALYKRPRDDVIFAMVAPKTGGEANYLWQYRLDSGTTGIRASLVRRFGRFSRAGAVPGEIGEIEAVVVDDASGYVYYSDERYGIRKYHADPDHPDAARELVVFGTTGFVGDREGLAILSTGERSGFIVASDQVDNESRVKLYPREGTQGNPHDHPEVASVTTMSDGTDGLEATSRALPGYPRGLLVMMNARDRNFLLYDWGAVAARLRH